MTTLLDRAVVRADGLMRKSERALASARLLHEHGDSEGTCSRAFYAMFYAAQAALLTVGVHPDAVIVRTHPALIARFGQHLVLPGHIDPAFGRAFSRAEHRRAAADDLSAMPSRAEAEEGLADAEAFLRAIRTSFPEL